MTLKELADKKHLRSHKTSTQEIGNLLNIVERDMHDATVAGLSSDARFVAAYNAALKLCTILVYASGYRITGLGAH